MLLGKQTIPFWWDMVIIAAFSIVVYYAAARLAEPREYVAQAVAVADEEINLGEVTRKAGESTQTSPVTATRAIPQR